jgi:hypothetical protein
MPEPGRDTTAGLGAGSLSTERTIGTGYEETSGYSLNCQELFSAIFVNRPDRLFMTRY